MYDKPLSGSARRTQPRTGMGTLTLAPLAGSWGTLAVMTEVTLKVMPRPESERTLLLRGLDDVVANRAMTAALGSPFDVSGAAHLPTSAFRTAMSAPGDTGSPGQALTLLRLFIHRHKALTAAASLIVLLTIGFLFKVNAEKRAAQEAAVRATEAERVAEAN